MASSPPGDKVHPIDAHVELDGTQWRATIASIGVIADPKTSLIPVVLEVQNPDENLACGVRVDVCFKLQ
jgi:hypothetical protein